MQPVSTAKALPLFPAALQKSLSGKVKITHPLEERPFGQVFGVADPAGETQYLVEFAKERPSNEVK